MVKKRWGMRVKRGMGGVLFSLVDAAGNVDRFRVRMGKGDSFYIFASSSVTSSPAAPLPGQAVSPAPFTDATPTISSVIMTGATIGTLILTAAWAP